MDLGMVVETSCKLLEQWLDHQREWGSRNNSANSDEDLPKSSYIKDVGLIHLDVEPRI